MEYAPKPVPKRIENNSVTDYDEHMFETGQNADGEKVLRNRLANEDGLFKQNEVNASVYKFNPNAIAIFIGYLFLIFWFFRILLDGTSVGVGLILFGAILVFIPLYIQNTGNRRFKAKIPDAGSLVFTADEVRYKGESYAIADKRYLKTILSFRKW